MKLNYNKWCNLLKFKKQEDLVKKYLHINLNHKLAWMLFLNCKGLYWITSKITTVVNRVIINKIKIWTTKVWAIKIWITKVWAIKIWITKTWVVKTWVIKITSSLKIKTINYKWITMYNNCKIYFNRIDKKLNRYLELFKIISIPIWINSVKWEIYYKIAKVYNKTISCLNNCSNSKINSSNNIYKFKLKLTNWLIAYNKINRNLYKWTVNLNLDKWTVNLRVDNKITKISLKIKWNNSISNK